MKGFAVRVHIPVASLGRLRLPTSQWRCRWGWARFGWSPARDKVIVTLEDREGVAIRFPSLGEVRAVARALGWAVCIALMRHNHYQAGEHPGDATMIAVPASNYDGYVPKACHAVAPA